MNDAFTSDQMADLMTINKICAELEAALVLIGAMSLIVCMDDIGRFTRGVDLTAALDLDEFALLADRLTAAGWTQAPRLEHRWIAPRKTIVDLLPAGPKLRSAGSIEWPLSQFAMSLAGFDHVFANARRSAAHKRRAHSRRATDRYGVA
jgi:predicted nucleotidyltransferase